MPTRPLRIARRAGFAHVRADPADAHPRTSSPEAEESLRQARNTAAAREARRQPGIVSAPGRGLFCIERILEVYPLS